MENNPEPVTKGTILLVDDLPQNLQLLTDILIERHYTVRRVTSGKMAIKTMRVKLPDLILLDINMPEMNGYEVCQVLKADPDLCDIPVIFMSALNETLDKVKAFEVGGVDYITKPFHIEEVLVRLENQLTIQRQKQALQDEITKRQATEFILDQSRSLLASVLNNSLDGIAAIETIRDAVTGNIINFRCLMINQVICQALGVKLEELIDKPIVKEFLDQINSQLFDRFVAVVETGESLTDDLYYPLGNSCWYNYIVVKLGDGLSITVRDITVRKQAEIALKDSETRFSTIFHQSPEPMWIGTLAEGRCLNVNESFCRFFGLPREQILGRNRVELGVWRNIEDFQRFKQAIMEADIIQNFETVLNLPSGETKNLLASAKKEILNGEDCLIGVIKDISDRKKFETFLRQYERIVSATTDAMGLIDSNYNYLIVNQTYLNWNAKTKEEVIGHSISEVLGQERFETMVKPRIDRCLAGENMQFEQWFHFQDNQRRFIRAKYSPYIDLDGKITGVAVNIHDITDIKQIEQELQEANQTLERMANLDGLTQIANRRRFDDYLGQEWQRHLREQEPLGLILIDIDYFKKYNDYYGHQGGDICLIQVAQTIAKIPQRATDLVARYGGEEFAIILPNTSSENALIVAEEIRKAIALLQIPHANSQVSDYVTLSLGIASIIPTLQNSSDDLIAQADQALYFAKAQGRDRAIFL
jgi:diguanylate cyclase (GGDEF)-like protein/PAS domain S-box-containing protein